MKCLLGVTVLVQMALAISVNAFAADGTIYRCGPDGRQWSQMPCEGSVRVTKPQDPEAEDVALAKARASSDAKLAAQMRTERLQREREQSRHISQAGGIKPTPMPTTTASNAGTKYKYIPPKK